MSGEKEKRLLDEQQPNHSNNIISDKERFLNTFYKNLSGFIEIREISTLEEEAKSIYFDDLKQALNYNPPKDREVYIGLFTRKRKKGKRKDIKETQALWLDFDNVQDYVNVEYLLNTKNLPKPTAVVNSGRGFHVYYKLDQPAGEEVEPVLKKLVNITGSDSQTAELARTMRLPGTVNTKYDDPISCTLEFINDNTVNLKELAKKLEVEAKPIKKLSGTPKEAATSLGIDYKEIVNREDLPCMKSMLQGVEVGQRNWILGRITKHAKNNLKFSKNKSKKMVRVWNLCNEEQLPEKELLNSFNGYWHQEYNLLGCKIIDINGDIMNDKQQILDKYCEKSGCRLSNEIRVQEGDHVIEYNNRIFNNVANISVNSLIIYGILAVNKQGLSAKRAAEIIGITKKTFRKRVKELLNIGYVSKKKGIVQRGIPDLYYLNHQGTFNLGRTVISYAAIRTGLAELKLKEIKPVHFKVYLLLRYYEYKSNKREAYPSTETLANQLGTTRARVSNYVNHLEKRDFIDIDRTKYFSNLYKIKIR